MSQYDAQALCSYLPASILSFLEKSYAEDEFKSFNPPLRQKYQSVCLFADVSGYTALCEAMAAKGNYGDEYLARHLNSYFELLVRTMSSQGGDVFKFAGDAIVVLWPPSDEEDLTTLCRRAAQCALEINGSLQDVKLEPGLSLSVKVGVGVGDISILHIGGVFGRLEYCATGVPLLQAFDAEHHAVKGEVILSPEVWELVEDYFTARPFKENNKFAYIMDCLIPLKKVNIHKKKEHMASIRPEVLDKVGRYVPSAVLPWVNHHEEKWASELRRITVVFVNLGLNPVELSESNISKLVLDTVQDVLQAVQHAVYMYEGSLNKFLMDDKGSTLIAVFGLPPLAHEDDPVRGVLAALAICTKLKDLHKHPAIGITTGRAFCGVVGARGRREYSVLGDTVNLSARLMQHATAQGGGIVCDNATQYAARNRLTFEEQPTIKVKGKTNPVKIFQPYSKSVAHLFQDPKKDEKSGGHGHGASHPPLTTGASTSVLQPRTPAGEAAAHPMLHDMHKSESSVGLLHGKNPQAKIGIQSIRSGMDVFEEELKSKSSVHTTTTTTTVDTSPPTPLPAGVVPAPPPPPTLPTPAPSSPASPTPAPPRMLLESIQNFQLAGYANQHFTSVNSSKKAKGARRDNVRDSLLQKAISNSESGQQNLSGIGPALVQITRGVGTPARSSMMVGSQLSPVSSPSSSLHTHAEDEKLDPRKRLPLC